MGVNRLGDYVGADFCFPQEHDVMIVCDVGGGTTVRESLLSTAFVISSNMNEGFECPPGYKYQLDWIDQSTADGCRARCVFFLRISCFSDERIIQRCYN
jgi:hypothetical protein